MHILLLPGDGIGPEITEATRTVLAAAGERTGLPLSFETRDIGFAALATDGTTLPDGVLERIRAVDGTVLGPIGHLDYPPRDQGGVNVSAAVRVKLDLYANVRPAKTRPGVPRVGRDMDLVIVRECTEGMYPDRNMTLGHAEFMPTPDVSLSMRKITRPACRRIAEWAFELARTRRKKVTAVHKANNFIVTDGLFLEEVRAVAAAYPDVTLDELIVDATAALAGARAVALRRHRLDELLLRHPLGPRLGTFGRARSRRLGQRQRHALRRPGPARLGARHRRDGQGEPDVADPLGGHAPRLARGADRGRARRGRGGGDARCRRCLPRRSSAAHRRSRRPARHRRLRPSGRGGAVTAVSPPVWDCHVHVFEPGVPFEPLRAYTPEPAPVAALTSHLARVGASRAVLVQATPHGDDNSGVLAALDRMGPEHRAVIAPARGLGVDALLALRDRGVRGLRLNPMRRIDTADAAIRAEIARLGRLAADAGMVFELSVAAPVLTEIEPEIAALPCPLVLPHLADLAAVADREARMRLVALLERHGAWVKLSAFDRYSPAGAAAATALLVEAFPERLVWGSDWPHTPFHDGLPVTDDRPHPARVVDDVAMRAALAAKLGAEAERVFAANPVALYG